MPRGLLLFEFPTLNGGERSLLAVLPFLQQAGWKFDALCPPTGPLAEALRRHAVRLPSPLAGEGPGVRGELLRALISSYRYDLVHANSLSMARLSGPIVAEAGVPSIAHLRDIVGLKAAVVADLNRHSRLLAVSQATRDYHVAQGLDSAKLHVVYNGIDFRVWLPSPLVGAGPPTSSSPLAPVLRGEGSGVRGKKTIGLIGQIILRKGQDIALAAAFEVMRTRPDVEVVHVGARHSEKPETIEYERCLHELVAAAGLTDRIRFLGTRDDVAELLPTLALLLHTPRQEPLGRVLLEAAACGVPIVATDVGGTREIFPRGEADGAIPVPVDDAAAAAFACGRLLDDPQLAAAMGSAGRRRMETAFSVERAAAELLRHYDEVAR